jgi:hypothetical protein
MAPRRATSPSGSRIRSTLPSRTTRRRAQEFQTHREAEATVASPAYEAGWLTGAANAGGTGADISAYGPVTTVTRTGPTLVAELLDGREDGCVRASIRFASPVCEAAAGALPTSTPPAAPAAGDWRASSAPCRANRDTH